MRYPTLKLPSSLLLTVLLAAPSLSAKVSVASLFQNGAVLQQQQKVPIWGKAEAGESITVSFGGQILTTTANAQGKWRVDLAPMEVNATGADLVIAGSANTVNRTDILVGEVWLCSGQSNMEWPLSKADGAKEATATANFPLIRWFKVSQSAAGSPQEKVGGSWKACGPKTSSSMSAVAFFFARDLHQELGVPIGIIQSAVNGTQIEAWLSEDSLKSDPALGVVIERREKALADFPANSAAYKEKLAIWNQEVAAAKAAGTKFEGKKPEQPMGPGHFNFPVAFYNGMIHPLAPYGLRGAIWYQGESNTGRAEEYRVMLPTLIKVWRNQWSQGDFPFLIVQLPNYGATPVGFAALREAQAETAAKVPNTGLAVTLDVGDVQDLHPKNKLDVGLRLARIAKAKWYGKKDIEFSGPVLKDMAVGRGVIHIRFDHGQGLNARGGAPTGFEIAGEDKNFQPAKAAIEEGGIIRLASDKVPAPIHVRYGWNVAGPNIFNGAGLPAAPFRAEAKLP